MKEMKQIFFVQVMSINIKMNPVGVENMKRIVQRNGWAEVR